MTGYKQEEMVGKANYEYAIPFYSQRRPLVCDFIFDRYIDCKKPLKFEPRALASGNVLEANIKQAFRNCTKVRLV